MTSFLPDNPDGHRGVYGRICHPVRMAPRQTKRAQNIDINEYDDFHEKSPSSSLSENDPIAASHVLEGTPSARRQSNWPAGRRFCPLMSSRLLSRDA
jgi:hypothetical protein